MPHLFVNRARYHGPLSQLEDLQSHFRWEVFNATAYQLGGIIFIIGSIFFLPQFEAHVALGSWLFVVGSILYLIVSCHDVYEVLSIMKRHKNKEQEVESKNNEVSQSNPGLEEQTGDSSIKQSTTEETKKSSIVGDVNDDDEGILEFRAMEKWKLSVDLASGCVYLVGTILFILGSVFFLPSVGLFTAGAWTFILGSIFFIAGAAINSVQIFESPTPLLAMYANATALCYTIGSTLFLTGSVPYLWSFETPDDAEIVYDYLGWQFIMGSVCFTLGGFVNGGRVKANDLHWAKMRKVNKGRN